MSLADALRAIPTHLKVSFSEAVAYRAEMFVWFLSTTMPFVMWGLWSAVAQDAPVGRFGQSGFRTYFLATFIVRQLTGAWAAWQMNFEVRQGTLAMRLLRPFHPLWSYAIENLAAMPIRLVVVIPLTAVVVWTAAPGELPRGALGVLWFALSVIGGWLITFLVNVLVGCLSFFMESSIKVMEVWFTLFFIFSGYLFPLELAPGWLRSLAEALPFRYQIGLPVELLTGAHGPGAAAKLLAQQWAYVAVLLALTAWVWRRGLRRFAAFGG